MDIYQILVTHNREWTAREFLFFVIVFKMGVAGVALATIISQAISAVLIVLCLIKMEGPCHLDLKHLQFHGKTLAAMLRIGLPAGLQGAVFSISNVLIQSSVNSFGSLVMAGNTAASNGSPNSGIKDAGAPKS